ncbi:MAG: peptidase dimerization domain-containing protein [Candidatus Aenigmarchaeota archaeon]|nr:peptidase dimerization domain-containing protein [Candidatus Aenigmarchaeota archaeon]
MPIYRLTVFGKQSHASMPCSGVNAIRYGARLISMMEMRLVSIEGGLADNIIPPSCEFTFSSEKSLRELRKNATEQMEKIKEEGDRLVKKNLRYEIELLYP